MQEYGGKNLEVQLLLQLLQQGQGEGGEGGRMLEVHQLLQLSVKSQASTQRSALLEKGEL